MSKNIAPKNQNAIVKRIMAQIDDAKYFEVGFSDRKTSFIPPKDLDTDLEKIRGKMKKLGLGPNSVSEAIEWAYTISR